MVLPSYPSSYLPTETGAVFTYGLSRFADNEPGKFWVRNDKVVQVACGEEHTVLITGELLTFLAICIIALHFINVPSSESGRAFSFGKNDWGQLGVGKNFSVHNKPSCIKGEYLRVYQQLLSFVFMFFYFLIQLNEQSET